MRLFEVEGKRVLARYGVTVPEGQLIFERTTPAVLPRLLPGVLKAQVLSGSRGKRGGVLDVDTQAAVKAAAGMLFERGLGEPVRFALLEERLEILEELYLSIALDREERALVILSNRSGGVEVEHAMDAVHRQLVDFCLGYQPFIERETVRRLRGPEWPTTAEAQLKATIRGLYEAVTKEELLLAEINPLVLTVDGRMIAADAKMVVDENALSRHPSIIDPALDEYRFSSLEESARDLGFRIVEFSGEATIIASGAGEGMALLDALSARGVSIRAWLDLGGSAMSTTEEQFVRLLELAEETHPRVLVFSAFFQIGLCTTFASAFKRMWQRSRPLSSVVIRLEGRGADEAHALLRGTPFHHTRSFSEACDMAARLSEV